ncbi:hypothetical protein NLI96_g6789 [Meripilus lineatus]|uniref:Uncharacterized protein n=1 Tax=Meripilus lineatus TaxID=2056292 RepID=A0AAD5V2K9_9APHY|nr:hypothetical protein NLI96_g6789 [Physisporinus lineatus]
MSTSIAFSYLNSAMETVASLLHYFPKDYLPSILSPKASLAPKPDSEVSRCKVPDFNEQSSSPNPKMRYTGTNWKIDFRFKKIQRAKNAALNASGFSPVLPEESPNKRSKSRWDCEEFQKKRRFNCAMDYQRIQRKGSTKLGGKKTSVDE